MRTLALLCFLSLSACSTVVPMQTASAVDRGRFRVGGQLSAAAWCGSTNNALGVLSCTDYPDGIPLPELRVNTRYGLGHGFDVGGSVQAQGQLFAPERPFQLGLTLDVKGELLRIPTQHGPTHIVSIGLLGSGALAGRLGLPLWTQTEWSVPVFYGLQLPRWEIVAGVSATQRFVRSPNVSPSVDSVRMGFTLGLFTRSPAGLAVQVGYLTDPARFSLGAIQLQVGLFWDVG